MNPKFGAQLGAALDACRADGKRYAEMIERGEVLDLEELTQRLGHAYAHELPKRVQGLAVLFMLSCTIEAQADKAMSAESPNAN